jgi:hypothetical protein
VHGAAWLLHCGVRVSEGAPEFINIFKSRNVQCWHCVQAKQIQPRHAQMHALDRPIVETSDTKRATITNALTQDFPGITEIIAIFPDYPGHVAEVLGFGLTQPEGNCGFEFSLPIFLNAMRHG